VHPFHWAGFVEHNNQKVYKILPEDGGSRWNPSQKIEPISTIFFDVSTIREDRKQKFK